MSVAMDEQDEFDILNMYQQGVSVDTIADEFGYDKKTVYRLLRSKGVLKEKGRYSILDKFSEETLNEFTKDYITGMKMRDMCEKYDISSPSVYAVLSQLGIQPRTLNREYLTAKKSQMDQAVQFYIDGWELWRIEVETGVSQPSLHKQLHIRGVKLRREYMVGPRK